MNKLIKINLLLLLITAVVTLVFHPSPAFATENGIISGQVTNQLGAGIANIRVAASTARVPGPGEDFSALTDINGYYTITIFNSLPASFYVLASGNNIYAGKFYPNAVNPKNAKTVRVSPSLEVTSIDFRLEPGFTISGTIKDTFGSLIPNINVIAFYEGEAPPLGFGRTNSLGTYTTSALSPGNYYLHAGDNNGYLGVFYPDALYVYGNPIPPQGAIHIKITSQNVSGYNFVVQKSNNTTTDNMISNLLNLVTLEPNNKQFGKTIDKVVKYLQSLYGTSGIGYFNLEQKIVKELFTSIKTGGLSYQARFAFEEAIKKLVEMAKVKAQTAILEAKSLQVRNPAYTFEVPYIIEMAEEEMTRAGNLQFSNSDQAIESYGLAWKYAQNAMVLANKK